MAHFFDCQLRTTDVASARAFYAAVLGHDRASIVPLHEQALARGARPHWLGYVDVPDVDATVRAFAGRGAEQLGPTWAVPGRVRAAVLRGPGGAVFAVATPLGTAPIAHALTPDGPGVDVAWRLLHAEDVERAKRTFGDLFSWDLRAPRDLGALGVMHPFGYAKGEPVAGAMTDIAASPAVHPHWLHHFRVASVDASVEAVRAGGGIVVADVVPPSGGRVIVCDDAQGAAFALCERALS